MTSLNMLHKIDQIDLINWTELNGVPFELNVSKNFTRRQMDALDIADIRYKLLKYPVDYFSDLAELSIPERTFARQLAFYRRISFPIELSLRQNFPIERYPLDTLKNFEVLKTLFERYYEKYDKSNNAVRMKSKTYMSFRGFTLKLWMSGYGLLPGLTTNHITDEFINNLLEIHATKRVYTLTKFCRFITFALSQEEESPVSEVCRLKTLTPLKDREIGKWSKLAEKYSSQVILELERFTFENIYPRTIQNTLHEYYDHSGTLQRTTYNKIAVGSFVSISGGLRKSAIFLHEMKITSIDDALNGGIFNMLVDMVSSETDSVQQNVKISIKHWVQWYICEKNLDYNINKIVPISVKQKPTTFGRVLNYGDMIRLVDALLDNDCPFYQNQTLMDYRCRYICLLMLSSGQRVSEICGLPYDCIKTDNRDCTFLVLPRTKTGNGNVVEATPDILEYVGNLREKAPSLPILFSSQLHKTGDDLKILRLSSDKFETGPILGPTVNNFLHRLQEFIIDDTTTKTLTHSSHDFRRMRAVYMKLLNRSSEDIQDQLGQQDIRSQLPYLQTKPLEHQKYFEEIYKEGVYAQSEDELIDTVSARTSRLRYTKADDYSPLLKGLVDSIEIADDFQVPAADTSSLSPIGFPIGIYSCNATAMTNCNASPIICFSCDSYTPDKNSLLDHTIEIFRYIVLNLVQQKMLKSTKEQLNKLILTDKIRRISNNIDEAFDKLFIKFNIDTKEANALKETLQKKSEKYFKQYGKVSPAPSFKEAKKYLEEE